MRKILLQFINCSNLFYNELNITIKDKDNIMEKQINMVISHIILKKMKYI